MERFDDIEEKEPGVTLKFRLHSDSEELNGMLKASDYHSVIYDIQQYVRAIYNEKNWDISEYFKTIRDEIKKEDEKRLNSTEPFMIYDIECMYRRIADKMQDKMVDDISDIINNSKYSEDDYR